MRVTDGMDQALREREGSWAPPETQGPDPTKDGFGANQLKESR